MRKDTSEKNRTTSVSRISNISAVNEDANIA